MKAFNVPKLHQEDPSGFWHLIRTGKVLPEVGEQILFVHDIRGTEAELRHDLLMRIANGDPYKITNDNPPNLPAGVSAMHAELLKLPTKTAVPKTVVGIVDGIGFDAVLQEHWISIKSRSNLWSTQYSPDHIIYWAPLPVPADTFIPRDDNFDLHFVNNLYYRDEQELSAARNTADAAQEQ